jgi:homoserine O-acetyltransferase
MSDAARIVRVADDFAMKRGGCLAEVQLAYECWGERNRDGSNVVLLFTGLSPSAHAASCTEDSTPGWWEWMIGPGKPIDTEVYYVICVNALGSCFGSTGPASVNPETGRPYGPDFPELSIEDMARSAHALMELLGIDSLHTVVGVSLGGMTALAYAIEFAAHVEQLVVISSAMRAEAAAIAVRSLQREIIRSDPAWQDGWYFPEPGPVNGMRLARKLGIISYRSAEEWRQRFGHDRLPSAGAASADFGLEFQVESYLDANARKFVSRFDANCYLYLSRSMDWFDVSQFGGTDEAALARITARRVLVIGVESDTLYPLRQQRTLADLLCELGRDVEFVAMPSLQGHDAFLVDRDRFAPVMRSFFLDHTLLAEKGRYLVRQCAATA